MVQSDVPATPLIPILSRPVGDEVNSVDARELHRVLEVGRDFSNWIKARIGDLGLVEDIDYGKFNDFASPNLASANRIDYALTLDAAKHVAMAERTEKGRQVRAYFIEAEKKLRALAPVPAAASAVPDLRNTETTVALLAQSLQVLQEERAKRIEAETALAVATPKANLFDRFVEADGLYTLQNAARSLEQPPNRFIGALKEAGILTYQGESLIARAAFSCELRPYFRHRAREYAKSDGRRGSRTQVFVTQKGLAWLAQAIASGKLVVPRSA